MSDELIDCYGIYINWPSLEGHWVIDLDDEIYVLLPTEPLTNNPTRFVRIDKETKDCDIAPFYHISPPQLLEMGTYKLIGGFYTITNPTEFILIRR